MCAVLEHIQCHFPMQLLSQPLHCITNLPLHSTYVYCTCTIVHMCINLLNLIVIVLHPGLIIDDLVLLQLYKYTITRAIIGDPNLRWHHDASTANLIISGGRMGQSNLLCKTYWTNYNEAQSGKSKKLKKKRLHLETCVQDAQKN